ncbi:transporter substrate-binding domain-containing protein [Aeromonas australiensis]|uniref:substrate-binding periplasmic protein n=1 Tax=Aeromonas australiensis TaxID=1114880 RepID=UPI001F241C45|nr:transporter substrate-binding domain-containing protein [Aeromonas australiensis]MCF3099593.1 transporter substrate-binding domain-containing protein [Aeromonas australiensis]
MRIWLISHLLLLCWATTARADLDKLEYFTEEYPPYNFSDPQGQPTGLAVELLQMIWQNSGIEPQPVRILPWARGYYLLTQKPDVVLFSTARTQAREDLFKWVCPIGYSEYILLGRKEKGLTLTDFAQMSQYKISAVRSDAAEQLLLNNGMNDTNIIPANRLSQGLKMLQSGRADLLATSKLAGYDAIRELNLEPDDFQVAMVLSAEQLCYAFSRQVDDQQIRRFQQALTRALASDEFRKLQAKYLPLP